MESAGYISRCVFVAQTSNIAVTQDNSKSSRLKCTKLLEVVWWGDGEWNEHNELKNQDEKINDSNFYVISISWAGVWAAYNLFQIDLNGWTFDCKIASFALFLSHWLFFNACSSWTELWVSGCFSQWKGSWIFKITLFYIIYSMANKVCHM